MSIAVDDSEVVFGREGIVSDGLFGVQTKFAAKLFLFFGK